MIDPPSQSPLYTYQYKPILIKMIHYPYSAFLKVLYRIKRILKTYKNFRRGSRGQKVKDPSQGYVNMIDWNVTNHISEESLGLIRLKERQVAVFTASCEIRDDKCFLRCFQFFAQGEEGGMEGPEDQTRWGKTVMFWRFAGCFYMCPVVVKLVLSFITWGPSCDLILALMQSMGNGSLLQ